MLALHRWYWVAELAALDGISKVVAAACNSEYASSEGESRVSDEIASAQGRPGPPRHVPVAICSDPEPMLARLVRGCIALAFTACVLADACSHHLAHTIKGGELSYMALALQREPTAYRSLVMVAGAVLADPEPMLARLVRTRSDAIAPAHSLHSLRRTRSDALAPAHSL